MILLGVENWKLVLGLSWTLPCAPYTVDFNLHPCTVITQSHECNHFLKLWGSFQRIIES